MARRTKNKGISRIDSRATHGWFVRGYKNGKTFSKLFSDLKRGGKTIALDMATAYRDELHSKVEKILQKERARRIVYSNCRNTTGVLGGVSHSNLEFQREGPRAFHGYLGTRAGRAEMHFILNPQIRREEGFPVGGSTP